MDMWDKRQDEKNRNRRQNPSFSSTLLDSIYRSIDESNGSKTQEELIFSNSSLKGAEMNSLQRACMIEKWMEKKVICDNTRRKSTADSDRNYRTHHLDDPMLLNSSSSSSDSSSGARFSSSESDSFYRVNRPKPIRTTRTSVESGFHSRGYDATSTGASTQQKPKHEGGFVRTKSKALKIYSELKKAKHPISPGGRLASFLNSIFSTTGNAKKPKVSSKSEPQTTTCSSASSFSRSCLSKTPSSRGNGTKRSVRFCLDDDHNQKPIDKWCIVEENRRVVEAAKDLLKNYKQKKEEYDEDEDEDAASCASSDLFELDNLSGYRQELPVYETTHLHTNRAIANGSIV